MIALLHIIFACTRILSAVIVCQLPFGTYLRHILRCNVLNRRLTVTSDSADFANYVMQVAPAMNTFMWDSPFTSDHLFKLQKLGAIVIPPISKTLACGDIGNGAMATILDIAAQVHHVVKTRQPSH